MKRLLLFPLFLLLELVKNNPAKSILFLVMFISFYFANQFLYDDVTEQRTIISEIKNGSDYIYLYKEGTEYKTIKYDKPLKLVNNIQTYKDIQGGYVLLTIVGGIIAAFLIITFFVGLSDDDASWEFSDNYQEAISYLISCEIENGKFYYLALGRLLLENDRQFNTYNNIAKVLNINTFKDIYNCPKFKTKTSDRNDKLHKLGI
jgi:hypothetical protein